MALVWNGITFTDWFHCNSRRTRAPVNKDIAYAGCSGRDVMNLGSGIDRVTSKSIVFDSQGNKHNCFKESAKATILTKINSIRDKYVDGDDGTLSFDNETHYNMILALFEIMGDIRPIKSDGTTYWICYFRAVFQEEYS